jgi:biopolymer transport protein ExbD
VQIRRLTLPIAPATCVALLLLCLTVVELPLTPIHGLTGFRLATLVPCQSGSDRDPLIVISIHARDELAINSEIVPFSRLRSTLHEILESRVEKVVLVFPDRGTSFETVGKTLDAVQGLGITRTVLLTSKSEAQLRRDRFVGDCLVTGSL